MAETPKKLFGDQLPAASETQLYHPTTIQNTIISTIAICNAGSATTVRLSHGTSSSMTVNDYILYDAPIEANTTLFLTVGICVSNNDYIKAYAGTASVTFIGWGVETT